MLAARYDVTTHAIYKRASAEDWQKSRGIDPATHGPMPAWAVPGPSAGSEPMGLPVPQDAEAPADLSRAALRGVAGAMRAGRIEEAKTLAGLADVLSRVSERAPGAGLEMVVRALHDPAYRSELLGIWGDPDPDPIKKGYWEEEGRRRRAADDAAWTRRREQDAISEELERLKAVVARVAPAELGGSA